jgi:hypothetical protein
MLSDNLSRYQTYKTKIGFYTIDLETVPKEDKEAASEDLQHTLDLLFWKDPDLTVESSDDVPESPDASIHKIFEWDSEDKKWKRSESDPTYIAETSIDDLLESVDV